MKIPQTPPAWPQLFAQLHGDAHKIVSFTQLYADPSWDAAYLHWDDFRRRPLPAGLSAAEAWAITKFKRSAQFSKLPLLDKGGEAFRFACTPDMLQTLHQLDLASGGKIAMPDEITNQSTRDRYVVSSLMEESIHSSLLEGAAVTRVQAKEILRSGRAPASEGERMIVNNYLTMSRLSALQKQPLTPELLLEIQQGLTEGTLDDSSASGRWRREDEAVRVEDSITQDIVHLPPPAAEIPARMEALCAFANAVGETTFVHPILRSIILHFWLAYDHPFVDGNGRTARALFYWSMLRHGYWLFEFISISSILVKSPRSYYRAFLLTETDENDVTYFLKQQLDVIEQAVAALHKFLERKAAEQTNLKRTIKGLHRFNRRQLALLQHALENPHAIVTFQSHQASHKVALQTARTDLLALTKLGLLVMKKEGRAFTFEPVTNFTRKLQNLPTN